MDRGHGSQSYGHQSVREMRDDTRVVRYGRPVGVSVTTPVFEGPIDLLLHLVTSHEIDVLDVPLAPVVDAFVATLHQGREAYSMEILSEFLLVAAILLELKSQRLLPGPDDVDPDDELVGWDDRDLLLSRLLECRAYAAVADALVAMTEEAAQSVPRQAGLEDDFAVHAPDLLAGVTLDKLARAFLRATEERPVAQVDLSHVTVDTLSVAEAVDELAIELPRRRNVTFAELTQHLATRIEVIVRFLALLELCKLGRVTLGQGHTFGQLQVGWIDGGDLVGVGVGAIVLDEYNG
jgi:segregation and condensation protein A